MKGKIFRFVSVLITITFLTQDIVWPFHAQTITTYQYNIPTDIHIPEQYGRVDKSADSEWLIDNSKKVILIKDAHCVYEVQKNIERILDILIRDYKIDLVCVEGASGKVDTRIFQSMPDRKARELASDKFVKKGYLSASEALLISRANELPFTIWGVEDEGLYIEDFNLFREAIRSSGLAEAFIKITKGIVNRLKDKIYNPELKEFDRNRQGYKGDELSLRDWVGYIRMHLWEVKRYKNLCLVVKAIRLENGIDFKKAEIEREEIIRGLEKVLPKEELRRLIEKSLLFRLGKIPAVEYYRYLEPYVTKSQINLKGYVHLIKVQSKIDEDILFKELEEIEDVLANTLFKNNIEKEIYYIDKNLDLLNKLFHLNMTREELDYYKLNIGNFSMKKIVDFLKIQAVVNGIGIPEELKAEGFIEEVEGYIKPAEEFYHLARARDRVIAKNLINRMEEGDKHIAVIIAGGFHSDGLEEELMARGVSCIEIAPRITKVQDDNPYLRLIMDEDMELDGLFPEEIALPLFCWRVAKGDLGGLKEFVNLMLNYSDRTIGELRGRIKDPGQMELFNELIERAGLSDSAKVKDLGKVFSINEFIDSVIMIAKTDLSLEGSEDLFIEYILWFLRMACEINDIDYLDGLTRLYNSLSGIEENLLIKKLKSSIENRPKVILVNLNHGSTLKSIKPLGLARISANLKDNNIYTTFIDGAKEQLSPEALAEEVLGLKTRMKGPVILGISVLPGDSEYLKGFLGSLSERIKDRKDFYICAGGYLPTMEVNEFMKKFYQIDFVIRAEGDVAMVGLVKAIEKGMPISEVENLVYRDKQGDIVTNKHHVLTEEQLNALPPPDYGMMIDEEDLFWKKALLDTSHGCSGNCIFCGLHRFFNEKHATTLAGVPLHKLRWRGRDPIKVVDEIEVLNLKYGMTGFDLVDDDFIGIDPDRARRIAEEILGRGLKINFWCLSRSDSIVKAGKDTIRLLRDAGLKMVFLGVESFDLEQLRFYRKGIIPEKNIEAIKLLKELGIEVRVGFINFYKNSTLEQIERNINGIEELGLESSIPTPCSILRVYKNTPLYDKYNREGVKLIPVGKDAFIYDFVDQKVDYLYKKAKVLADKSYPFMMHFKELGELQYYFPSELAIKAREVYESLKGLEFGFFKGVLDIVKANPVETLNGCDSRISGLTQDYYSRMVDIVKGFNEWLKRNNYEAGYIFPEDRFLDPLDRIYEILQKEEDAWIIFGDFMNLWDRNSVYGNQIMDIFIQEVIGIADSICKRYGGFSAHLVADEVVMVLPKKISSDKVRDILREINTEIYNYFNERYGFASLEIKDGNEGEIRKYLQDRSGVEAIVKLPVFVSQDNVRERYFILFDRNERDAVQALEELITPLGNRVEAKIDFDVLIPWLPMGTVKASYVPRADVREWVERILEKAGYMQRLAKSECKDLIKVAGKRDLISRDDIMPKEEKMIFSTDEKEGIDKEVKRLQGLLKHRRYKVENIYPSYLKSTLENILKDILFYSRNEAMLYKIDVGYEVIDEDIEKAFVESYGTREIRKTDKGKRIFGFKAIQGAYGHRVGNELILLINLLLDKKFRQKLLEYGIRIIRAPPEKFYLVFEKEDGRFSPVEEVLKIMDSVKEEMDKKLEKLGIKALFEVSVLKGMPIKEERLDSEKSEMVEEIMNKINLLSESREVGTQISLVSKGGNVLKDYSKISDDTLKRLYEEHLRVLVHQRGRSKKILKELQKKYKSEDILEKTTIHPRPLVLLFGYPASGKGTVGRMIAERLYIPHISIGAIIRDMLKANPQLDVNERSLGFDEITRTIKEGELDIDSGLIIDANPPFPGWREVFEEFMEKNNLFLSSVVHVKVDEETAWERILGRGREGDLMSLREDPKRKKAEIRIENYKRNVLPLIKHYKKTGYVIEIENTEPGIENLRKKVDKVVDIIREEAEEPISTTYNEILLTKIINIVVGLINYFLRESQMLKKMRRIYREIADAVEIESEVGLYRLKDLTAEIAYIVAVAILQKDEKFLKLEVLEDLADCLGPSRDERVFQWFAERLLQAGITLDEFEWLKEINSPMAKIIDKIWDRMDNNWKAAILMLEEFIKTTPFRIGNEGLRMLDKIPRDTKFPGIFGDYTGFFMYHSRVIRYTYEGLLEELKFLIPDINKDELIARLMLCTYIKKATFLDYLVSLIRKEHTVAKALEDYGVTYYSMFIPTSAVELLATIAHEMVHYLRYLGLLDRFSDVAWLLSSSLDGFIMYSIMGEEEYIAMGEGLFTQPTPRKTLYFIWGHGRGKNPLSGKEKDWQKIIRRIEKKIGPDASDKKEKKYNTFHKGLCLGLYALHRYGTKAGLFLLELYSTYFRELDFGKMELASGIFNRVLESNKRVVDETRLKEEIINLVKSSDININSTYEEIEKEIEALSQKLLKGNKVTPQIGKRAKVKQIIERDGKKYLLVVDAEDENIELGEVEITEQDSQLLSNALRSLQDKYPEYGKILEAFLETLQDSPHSFYTFSTLIRDLFGFASSENNLITLHESLLDNPIALFHEMGEYLIKMQKLKLQMQNGRLILIINDREYSIVLNDEAKTIAKKGPNNPHYLLRALQREIFGKEDKGLTEQIKDKQKEDVGLCVTADTLLPIVPSATRYQPSDVSLKPIVEVKQGDYVLSLNEETVQIEPHRIKGLLDMGIKPVCRLTTASGRSIKTTANHPYLTGNGWVKVSRLRPGDEIGVPGLMMPDSDSFGLNNKETAAQLLRADVFEKINCSVDSFYSPHMFDVYNNHTVRVFDSETDYIPKTFIKCEKDKRISEDIIENLFITSVSHPFVNCPFNLEPSIDKGVYKFGIYTMVSKDLHNRLFLRDNLGGFFTQDGSEFNSSNDILFGNAGILFRNFINDISRTDQIQDIRDSYPCSFNTGFPKSNFWVDRYSIHKSTSSHYHHPRKILYNAYKTLSNLMFLLEAEAAEMGTDILWDRITSIEYLGYEHVYDIEVEGTHNFIGNGIFAHNTYIKEGSQQVEEEVGQLVKEFKYTTPSGDIRAGFDIEKYNKIKEWVNSISEKDLSIDEKKKLLSNPNLMAKLYRTAYYSVFKDRIEEMVKSTAIKLMKPNEAIRYIKEKHGELYEKIGFNNKALMQALVIYYAYRGTSESGEKYEMAGATSFWDNKTGKEKDPDSFQVFDLIINACNKGLSCIELPIDYAPFDPSKRLPGEIGKAEREQIRILSDLLGIKLTVHSSILGTFHIVNNRFYQTLYDPIDNIGLMEEEIDFCKDIRAETLVVHIVALEKIKEYAELVIYAHKRGVRLALENYVTKDGRFHTSEQVVNFYRNLAEEVNEKNPEALEGIYHCFDAAHYNLTSDQEDPLVSAWELIKLAFELEEKYPSFNSAEFIKELHLNQNLGPIKFWTGFNADLHAPVSHKGPIWNEAIIALFFAYGFNPWVIAEQIPEVTEEDLELIVRGIEKGKGAVGREREGDVYNILEKIFSKDAVNCHKENRIYQSIITGKDFGEITEGICEKQIYNEGNVIIKEGEDGNEFYIITNGAVEVVKDGNVIARLSKGDIFGEIAVINGTKRTASVVVAEDGTEVILITKKLFDLLKERFVDLFEQISGITGKRLKQQLDKLKQGVLKLIEEIGNDLDEVKGLTEEQKEALADRILSIIKGVKEGKPPKIDLDILFEGVPSLKDKFFVVAKIARFVNNNMPDKGNKVEIIAAIEAEILKVIKESSNMRDLISEEEDLLKIAEKIAEQKGIDPQEIKNIFDLFRQGIDILTMDPELDPGQIDGSYFTLVREIERLTGISQGAILNAFKKNFEIDVRISQGKEIEGTRLYKSARLLKAYNDLWDDVQEMVIHEEIKEIKEKKVPTIVVFHISMFRDMPLVGLRAVLNSLKGDVKLGIRVPKGALDDVKKWLKQLRELGDKVVLLDEDIENVKKVYPNAVFVVDEKYVVPKEMKGTKIFGVSKDSVFHAVFLFGVMYARSENINEIEGLLNLLGIDKETREKMRNGEFFVVKLIRIKEVLEEFQNRRLTLDISA